VNDPQKRTQVAICPGLAGSIAHLLTEHRAKSEHPDVDVPELEFHTVLAFVARYAVQAGFTDAEFGELASEVIRSMRARAARGELI
jgi:hypothetical protein